MLAVEEEINGVDGIKRISSVSSEGVGSVMAELLLGTDSDRALNDIKSAVDRITSFPLNAERPVISLATSRRKVMSLVIRGPMDIKSLDRLAEDLRRGLLADSRITQIEKGGLPPPEISVEVSEENLRRYNLTLNQISAAVRAASIDLPGGSVKTSGGEVLVRTTERRDYGDEFREIILIARPDGTAVRLGEVADVIDGYRETDEESWYDGEPAVQLEIFRVGEESPLQVANAVREFLAARQPSLPPTVSLEIVDDQSKEYNDRISLLSRNGRLGALLVVLILGIFLKPNVAFWVSMGIPISFLGAFFLIPMLGVSINMISLFAFLLVLGIVVDDAVVVGEAVFHQRRTDKTRFEAAVDGTREVLVPVVFAVLTTMIAFAPLLFVPGVTGKFFRNIPLIVMPILFLSLVESLFILPAHLAHVKRRAQAGEGRVRWRLLRRVTDWQLRFSDGVESFIERRVPPLLSVLTRERYLTMAAAVGILLVSLSMVAGGRLKFNFFPRIEGDIATAVVELPFGAPVEQTRAVVETVAAAAVQVDRGIVGENPGETGGEQERTVIDGVFSRIGTTDTGAFGPGMGMATTGGHVAVVTTYLVPSEDRVIDVGSAEFTRRWREQVGELAGVDRISFNFNTGPSAGAKVSVQLAHDDIESLEGAASQVAAELGQYAGVFDIDDGFKVGKPQLDLELKPAAKGLGLTERDLADQVRGSFFGAEASRQQRGRDELRVYVRRPREERDSVHFIENLMIRTPNGGEIPLRQAAYVRQGRSFTEISRVDARRTVTVTADVDPGVTTGNEIRAALVRDILPPVMADTPGLTFTFGGEQEAQAESIASLGRGLVIAMLAMYAMMAVAFRSYGQPLVVLAAVPFGMVGAVLGHLVMGYDLSFLSIFGLVALAGVVVNDSLVLITAINNFRAEGSSLSVAVIRGTTRRVRPVLLTSLTTFFGLAPIILERSLQAKWLVPMALSLGFGVLFVTGIALVLVPCTYLMLEDFKRLFVRLWSPPEPSDHGAEPEPAGAAGS